VFKFFQDKLDYFKDLLLNPDEKYISIKPNQNLVLTKDSELNANLFLLQKTINSLSETFDCKTITGRVLKSKPETLSILLNNEVYLNDLSYTRENQYAIAFLDKYAAYTHSLIELNGACYSRYQISWKQLETINDNLNSPHIEKIPARTETRKIGLVI
jgi:hypothetical protein